MDTQKVSIYISTYNRVDKLRRAVDSVTNQTYKNIEILICDDASVDGTDKLVHELMEQDDRIFYLRSDINKGACEARNLGIMKASGKYITGLDDDDEFAPDRIMKFVSSWDERFSFLCANFIDRYINSNDMLHYKKGGDFLYQDLLFENLASNQVFTKTKYLQDIGGFVPGVKRLQDWDTWLRLSFKYGGFRRLDIATYIMNHDHLDGDKRVSKSSSIGSALLELAERNKNIYNSIDRKYMNYLVKYINGKESLSESFYWAFKNKNIKPLIKTILRKGHVL